MERRTDIVKEPRANEYQVSFKPLIRSNQKKIKYESNSHHYKDEQHTQHKLLQALIIIFILLNCIYLSITLFYPSYLVHGTIDIVILFSSLSLLLFLLFLTFKGYDIIASVITISTISVLILINIILDIQIIETYQYPTISFLIFYLIIPNFLISLFFRQKITSYFILANTLCLLCIPLFFQQTQIYEYVLNPLLFYLFISSIILYFRYRLDTSEKIRTQQIKKAKEESDDILNIAADGIRLIDKNYHIMNVNETLATMIGIPRKELIGRSCKDYFGSSEYCDTDDCSLKRILRTSDPFSRETIRYSKDGRQILCIEQVKPLKNSRNEIIGIIEDFQDITTLKNTQHQLKKEKDKAELYLDIANVVILILDTTGNVIRLNRKGYHILGYSEDEIITKNWFTLVLPTDMIEQEKQLYASYIQGEKPFPIQQQQEIITKSGEKRIIQWQISSLTDETDQITGIIESGMDITEELQSKQSKEIAEGILEKRSRAFHILYNTVLQIEKQPRDTTCNILCNNLISLSHAEVGLFSVCSIHDSEFHCYRYSMNTVKNIDDTIQDDLSGFSHTIRSDLIYEIRKENIKKYTNPRDIESLVPEGFFSKYPQLIQRSCYVISYPLNNGKILIGIVFLENNYRLQLKDMINAYMDLCSLIYQRNQSLIDLERSEDKYRTLSTQLENKVKERTTYIERLLKQKDEFIYQLGHDLKTPLNPLLNLIPLLQKKNDMPECHEMYDILIRNTQHMHNLVKKTLKLAQLNSPNSSFEFKQINVTDLIQDIIKKNTFLFEEKHISISVLVDNNIILEVDEMHFIELIDNLLTNAVKYSQDQSTITIDASVKDSMLTLSVHDQGIGLTIDQLNHMFEEFYKADGARHDMDSNGLGLPICKRIVEKHGGHIWAESEGLDKGTTVSFTLPLIQKKDQIILTN